MADNTLEITTLKAEMRLMRDAHKSEAHHMDVMSNLLCQLESRYETLLEDQDRKLTREQKAREKAVAELDALQRMKPNEAALQASLAELKTAKRELRAQRRDVQDLSTYHTHWRCKCGRLAPDGSCCPHCGHDRTDPEG